MARGRKKIPETSTVYVRLPNVLLDAIDEEARKYMVNTSTMVRLLLLENERFKGKLGG